MVRGKQMERIKTMTREEKYAELNAFFHVAQGLKLDIDELEKDRNLLGMTDADLDQAIMICSALCGNAFNALPMSAEELKAYIPNSPWVQTRLAFWNRMRGIRRNHSYAPAIAPELDQPGPPNWRKLDSKGSNLDRAVRVQEYLDKKDK